MGLKTQVINNIVVGGCHNMVLWREKRGEGGGQDSVNQCMLGGVEEEEGLELV